MLHIPPTNLLLLAAKHEPHKKAYLLKKNVEEFSGKSSAEWASRQRKRSGVFEFPSLPCLAKCIIFWLVTLKSRHPFVNNVVLFNVHKMLDTPHTIVGGWPILFLFLVVVGFLLFFVFLFIIVSHSLPDSSLPVPVNKRNKSSMFSIVV